MRKYQVNWKQVQSGVSYIEASSKKEAQEIADKDGVPDSIDDFNPVWEIESVMVSDEF